MFICCFGIRQGSESVQYHLDLNLGNTSCKSICATPFARPEVFQQLFFISYHVTNQGTSRSKSRSSMPTDLQAVFFRLRPKHVPTFMRSYARGDSSKLIHLSELSLKHPAPPRGRSDSLQHLLHGLPLLSPLPQPVSLNLTFVALCIGRGGLISLSAFSSASISAIWLYPYSQS